MRALLCLSTLLAVLLLAPSIASANAPAPWWACDKRIENDTCDPYGGGSGLCTLQPDCTDDPSTEINECLYCEATDDGGGCSLGGARSLALPWAVLLAGALVVLRRRWSRR